MAIYQGVNGVNREIRQIYQGVSGVNREIKERWEGVGGVNRQVYMRTPKITNVTIISNSDQKKIPEIITSSTPLEIGMPGSKTEFYFNDIVVTPSDEIEFDLIGSVGYWNTGIILRCAGGFVGDAYHIRSRTIIKMHPTESDFLRFVFRQEGYQSSGSFRIYSIKINGKPIFN